MAEVNETQVGDEDESRAQAGPPCKAGSSGHWGEGAGGAQGELTCVRGGADTEGGLRGRA